MILFILLILTGLFLVIAAKCDIRHEDIAIISCVLSAVVGLFLFAFIVAAVIVEVPYFKERKRIDFEQKYQSIMFCIEHEKIGTTSLASDISEYNSEILRGRMDQNSAWFSVITYDFYDDLPLIEIEMED